MTLFYIGMFLSLWTLGTIMLVNNYNNKYTYWMSIMFLIAGFASFSLVINQSFLPFLREHGTSPLQIEYIRITTIGLWGVEYHFLPYLFLMGSLVFSGRCSRNIYHLCFWGLLVPIMIYLFTVPTYYPEARFGGTIFKVISGLYFFAGIVMYLLSYYKEKNPVYRRNRFRTNLVVIAISFVYSSDYYGVNYILIGKHGLVMSSNNLWRFNFLIVIWLVLFFIYFGLRYGFMGIKLRIEQQKLDFSMRSLTEGTVILNHSLKNEVQKITYLSERIKDSIHFNQKEEALQDVCNILNVTKHMLDMVTRIKEKADEIVLKEQPQQLSQLLDTQLPSISTILQEKGITLQRHYQIDPVILCDPAHIQETFSNICLNAIDSMEPGKGKLEVILTEMQKEVALFIKDNGSGISKENAVKIFDPFFTTKKGSLHYGLGLSYCYSVMKKHGGTLKIFASEIGKGTIMEMRFPRKRILQLRASDKKDYMAESKKISV
ncbi:sensor histidine kinase [Neobacillus cucumis]|uniref:sensor histidine kinase n=1 Tax=Neobacillus cucumis TaxID=1740721 RepID=UPI0019663CCC|nr:HAMP domain-containing sensor histidine kinase [Neobacillus cucumis]MBM7652798.1 signal transduction histidine kinase [Neobacillus cucumis]